MRPTPPCILSARTVATTTAASGTRPEARHLMSKNFSAPMSAPKPASVTTMSEVARATRSAMIELLPWAMFANGPQWTQAGPPSSVWRRFGLIASRRSTVIAPATPRSSVVTALPSRFVATTIRPRRARRSNRSFERARIAITSEATVMTYSLSRGIPFSLPPRPMITRRIARSLMSTTRGQLMEKGSIPSAFPWWRWLSRKADARLCAAPIAWMSPVRWRLKSSIGMIWL